VAGQLLEGSHLACRQLVGPHVAWRQLTTRLRHSLNPGGLPPIN
jgi:hypothetical protein